MVTSLDESPETLFEAPAESSPAPRILSTAKGGGGPPLAVLSFQWSQCGLLDEVTALQQQNDSLKDLLQTYLGARVNEELIVPPNQTISLN